MNAKMKKAELIDLFENFDGDRKSDFIETYPEIWDDVYDIMEGSRYHRAMINCVKAGFEARDKIAQEREMKLVEALKECSVAKWQWEDGHLTEHDCAKVARQALANYKAEGEE